MGLKQYAKEELQEMSLIEVAYLFLAEKKQPFPFSDMLAEVASILELSDEQTRERISQFYTDVNIDGRFLCIGENKWGLRGWYPVDQIEEETVPTIRPKKKKSKKALDDDELETEDFDDIGEDDIDFDDLDEEYVEDELIEEEDDDDDFDDLDDDDDDEEEEFDEDDIIEDDEYSIDEEDDLADDDLDTEEEE